MKTPYPKRRPPALAAQRGLVLFIALIALVVMSLAAVALIRSVDTSTMIAGNLAFKQSATNSGDGGLLRGINTWLAAKSAVSPPTDLYSDSYTDGYYATATALATKNSYVGMTSYEMLTKDKTWGAANSAQGQVADCNGFFTSGTDCSGNTVRYVIERMCELPGPVLDTPAVPNPGQHCLFGPQSESTSGMGAKAAPEAGGLVTKSSQVVYRITVRSVGPKNSVSYIQSFLY